MKILGISCFYHEAAACFLVNGRIVAASAEERFSRKKHDASFPKQAIDFCLRQGNSSVKDIDYVVFYEKPFRKFERNLITSLQYFPRSSSFFVDSMKNFLTEKLWIKSIIISKLTIDGEKILFVPHHLSHAAASFYPSPFDRAAFLTLDGVGEWTTGSWGRAMQNRLQPEGELRFPHSVGLLYAAFTAFLGFEVNDGEYKVMGMVGYGKPRYLSRVKKLYRQAKDASLWLNIDYFAFHKSSKAMYSQKFVDLFTGLDKFDVAASLQAATEEIVFKMLSYIHQKTGEGNLVYGGGVALNSALNGKITTETPFKHVFIFPAAGDDGGAVGAALYLYHHVLGNKKRYELQNVFLGESFEGRLGKVKRLGRKLNDRELIDYVATKLTEGKVVGWFEGRAEFGPRALGHRSILADPRNPKMRDIVNSKIKFREEFRPFAPAILAEYAAEYFGKIDANLNSFMLSTCKATAKTKKTAPSIVHIDKTSRVQIVYKTYSGRFRKLLEAFYQKTGLPMLLNTSFNVKGEPIVNFPDDAHNTFKNSGLDILVVENYVLTKYT